MRFDQIFWIYCWDIELITHALREGRGLFVNNLIFIHFTKIFGVDYGAQKIRTTLFCYMHPLQDQEGTQTPSLKPNRHRGLLGPYCKGY